MDLNFYLINYNMNHQTDQNYEKLKKYIPQKNILILDNGSDKITPHKETKILLKENIKVSGAFRHIWDKEIAAKTKYVVTITSSATLLNYDYASAIKNDIKEMNKITQKSLK